MLTGLVVLAVIRAFTTNPFSVHLVAIDDKKAVRGYNNLTLAVKLHTALISCFSSVKRGILTITVVSIIALGRGCRLDLGLFIFDYRCLIHLTYLLIVYFYFTL
jgi:hypothetical protein